MTDNPIIVVLAAVVLVLAAVLLYALAALTWAQTRYKNAQATTILHHAGLLEVPASEGDA